MIDFKLTESGDIKLNNSEPLGLINIKFNVHEFPVMQIQFGIENNFSPAIALNDNICKVNFKVKDKSIKNLKQIQIIHEDDALRQYIVMQLQTEIGDLKYYPSYGSQLNDLRHFDIRSETLKGKLQRMVEDIVNGLLINPSVEIKYEKNDNSYFFCQNISIYIYSGDLLFYHFSL